MRKLKDSPTVRLQCALVCLVLTCGLTRSLADEQLFNKDWSIIVDDFSYSDLAFDERPGYSGREYLSGEWAAAVAYSIGTTQFGPTWLNPQFIFPDWDSHSDFGTNTVIEPTGATNSYGFPIYRSVIENPQLRIRIIMDMIDTTNGVPEGLSPRSAPSGSNILSDRYVFRVNFGLTNISGQTLTAVKFYKFLHSLQASKAVYDDRIYPGVFNGYRYTISQQGIDVGYNSLLNQPAVHADTVALHANVIPTAWEVGRYGIEGIDDHVFDKPSVGVHWSVEADSLSNLDYFAPSNRWVSGALCFDLGSLAPNASTNIEFLLSLQTTTTLAPRACHVVAWGDNSSHQTNVPVWLTNATAIAAGGAHSLALRTDGTLAAWGNNLSGQTNVPANLSNVISIAAGGNHSLALRADGRVVAWGSNSNGQTNVPANLTNVSMIAAGLAHSLALRNDGTVTAWGSNSSGQTNPPPGVDTVTAIAAGGNYGLALLYDGTVVGWGDNALGQASIPDLGFAWYAISAGSNHSLTIDYLGDVYGWGDDSQGQIGIPPSLTDVQQVAAGGSHSLALDWDGYVTAWGSNLSGQTSVPAISRVLAIAAGGGHSLALVPNPPLLQITRSGANVVISWPAGWSPDFQNVTLQRTATLNGPAIIWTPVVAQGQYQGANYQVILPISAQSQFFRLAY